MVLRIIILLIGLTSTLQAQDLFYTDSYQTNLYQYDKEFFIFNNNIFSLLDDSANNEVVGLILSFFEDNEISASFENSGSSTQLRFLYTSSSFMPLNWSINWHQKQGLELSVILNDFVKNYFKQQLEVPADIADASIHKHAYYNLQSHDNRVSKFTKTTLQISVKSINQKEFINTYLEPNLSLNRIVTKSFNNYFNEAYPIQNLEDKKSFVFGPSSKARLKDCVSLYLYTWINRNSSFVYLKDNTVLIDDSMKARLLTQNDFVNFKSKLNNSFLEDINSLDISFYNIEDKRSIAQVLEDYVLADYEEFIEIYFNQNSYNYALPVSRIADSYNKQILEERVFFKINDPNLVNNRDSLVLNSMASFLKDNTVEHLLILGFAGKSEYEKIDKKALDQIIDKYRDYPPVEESKAKDLSIYRAVKVFDFLAEKGVHPSRMSCLSKNIVGEKLADYAYCKFTLR